MSFLWANLERVLHGRFRRVSPKRIGVAGVMLPVLIVMSFAQCSPDDSDAESNGKSSPRGVPIHGGTFEASGIASVPGTGGALFVDDGRENEVVWIEIDALGQQVGEARPIPLGANVEDPEGITFDGSRFYVVGSQSSRRAGERIGLVRFAFDAATKSVTNVEAISGLRDFLVQNVPELGAQGAKKGDEGGLNIEGLAWDSERKRLLFGLRSPLANGFALVVPVRLRNAAGPFEIANLQIDEAGVIKIPIGGAGIRDIQYDNHTSSFMIISGAAENQEQTGFALWQWSVGQDQATLKLELAQKMKPEGVTRMEARSGAGTQQFLLIVGDASRYLKVDQ